MNKVIINYIKMEKKKKEDDDNLDNYYGESVFSVTEDVQYPLFDAEKAKSGILNQNADGPANKPPSLILETTDKSKFYSIHPNFGR